MQSSNCIHGVPDISLKPYSDFTDSMLPARHITTHYRRRKIRLHLTRPRNCSLSTRWEWSWSTTASSLERIRPLVSSSTWFRSNHPLVYILWNYRNIAGEVWSSSFKGSYASGSVCSHFPRHLSVIYQELWGENQGLWAPAEEVGQPKVGTLTYFSLSLVYLTEDHRLSYDAAISKLEKLKTSKKDKEKERKEAEDELQTARLR